MVVVFAHLLDLLIQIVDLLRSSLQQLVQIINTHFELGYLVFISLRCSV